MAAHTTGDSENLATWITPTLLTAIFDARCQWTETTQLNVYAEVTLYDSEKVMGRLFQLCWPVLKHLGTLGSDPNQVPDFMPLLPSPGTAEFPKHSLALIWLIDQGPRLWCSEGTNVRWLNSFYDPLAQRITAQLRALPEEQQPYRKHQWTELNKYTAEHWLIARIVFLLPVVHCERLSEQKYARQATSELREFIQKSYKNKDPYHEQLTGDVQDTISFSRWVRNRKSNYSKEIQLSDHLFHQLGLIDVHFPIIDKYGRYPYRNGAMARDNTKDEVKFLQDTDHFAEVDPQIATRIREDVKNNTWTPFIDNHKGL